ncbi:aminoglycoside phosphotransferase [Lentzea guizhouensis]|uniref:Aminoglycoside phosphotransferase n=1 Tax=Lentzea guizhouensis TaxID=1586287 RepID=A0A1B2HW79_9PSEU|nr:aminoglycoside phosphotransferase family protein [Lentzea guizhouensis]ANZ41942.1 aminoglycoside phosphotransferase [Lentzea guizhouensis]
MTAFATPEDIARRTTAAKDAAVAAGRDLGLTITEPKVLYELFSVVVHLAPSPVVARVPVVLPHTEDLDATTARQQRELDVARWLANQGTPVIPPADDVSAKPVQRDGFSITFWPFVEEDRSGEPDYVANSEKAAELHAALKDYPGELQFLGTAEPQFITESFRILEKHPDLLDPADRERAEREWAQLEPAVREQAEFEKRFPGIALQPIHGDCPPANIFASTNGPLFSDFELITYGPVEWDLASLGPDLEAAYNRGARANNTRELDDKVLEFVNAVAAVRAIAYLSVTPQLPQIAEFMKPLIDTWRARPTPA